jgi:small subunit ribosomal protein S9
MATIHKVGRRKTSVARVYITEGTGQIIVNKKEYKEYFPTLLLQYRMEQAFAVTGTTGQFDVKANVFGGGITGQVEAIRLAISKALVELNQENHAALKPIGLLSRDPRKVERKKYGQKKARKKYQFSKR